MADQTATTETVPRTQLHLPELRADAPVPPEYVPDVENLQTEDDTPVDNTFSEKQQRLLTESLYSSWTAHQFVAMANVGLFFSVHQPPLVPDVLLSLDVTTPENLWIKSHRSYFIWEYGKPPEVVIEIVSNKKGGETDMKLRDYARLGIVYYVVFDALRQLSDEALHVYRLRDGRYVELNEYWLDSVGLGLRLWSGDYENMQDTWLRWCDQNAQLIPTGKELAEQERQRSERLREQLRALGVDPAAD
jgi:Uma2 family endonuclease